MEREKEKFIDLLATYIMQFVVEATGIADGLSASVPSPKGCGGRLAIRTGGARSLGGALQRLKRLNFDKKKREIIIRKHLQN